MNTIDPTEPNRRNRKRILMPMFIIGFAIILGWWFPGQADQQQTEIERRVRAAIAHRCDADSPAPVIRWALPVVERAFGVATTYWCERGVDLDQITCSWGQGPEDTQLLSLASGDGSTVQLLISLEADGAVVISSVQHDPAGT